MIFYFNADGTAKSVLPETIVQGSNKANDIYFVCPLPYTNIVSVAFCLPNGTNTEKFIMTPKNGALGGILDECGNQYNAWHVCLPTVVTADCGKVFVQFYIANNEETLSTVVSEFIVRKGIVSNQPEQGQDFDEFIAFISGLNGTITNAVKDSADALEIANSFKQVIDTHESEIEGLKAVALDTVINQTVVEDTFVGRKTAGGLDIVDGIKTTVSKIYGDTVSPNLITYTGASFVNAGVTISQKQDDNGCIYYQLYGTTSGVGSITIATIALDAGTYIVRGGSEKATLLIIPPTIPYVNLTGGASEITLSANGNVSVMLNYTNGTVFQGDKIYLVISKTPSLINASFKGVESYGRNLLDIKQLINNVFFQNEDGTYTLKYISPSQRFSGAATLKVVAGQKIYCFYKMLQRKNHSSNTARVVFKNNKVLYLYPAGLGESVHGQTLEYDAKNYALYTSNLDEEYIFEYIKISLSPELPEEYFEPDRSFMLSEPIALGKYDYIDVENKKIYRYTGYTTKENVFTMDELSAYSEYLLSPDGKTVCYKLADPMILDIDISDGYVAYRNGFENIVEGEENSAYGAKCSIEQKYYVRVGD